VRRATGGKQELLGDIKLAMQELTAPDVTQTAAAAQDLLDQIKLGTTLR
jgi:hypothetical protein